MRIALDEDSQMKAASRLNVPATWRTFTGIICLWCLLSTTATASEPANTTIALQAGWRFSLATAAGAEEPGYDDSQWPLVHVPHNGREISDESPRSTRRVWFRKSFGLQRPGFPHSVVLEISQSRLVDVWVNGVSISDEAAVPGMFVADISDAVQTGNNALTIRAAVPGIQGGVQVHVRSDVHLESNSIRVDTDDWQGGPAAVRVQATIRNRSEDDRTIEVQTKVRGPDGALLAESPSDRRTIQAGQSLAVQLTTSPVTDPPLWSPETPRLCRVTLNVRSDSRTLETREVTFGFRWFRFDAEQGFFLNGEPLKLRGVVYAKIGPLRTQDRNQLWDYETSLLKKMGLNFVRPSRMIDESFLAACDRAGLLASVQIPPTQDAVEIEPIVHSVVSRLYNHPSIITWHFNGEGKNARVAALQSATARVLRRADPTRPVLCVELGWRSPGSVGLTDTDIAGQGNYTGWYEGTLDHIGPYMDAYRELIEERYGHALPVIISNYGAAGDSQVHSNSPRRNDYSHEYLTRFHERFEHEISRRPWVAGGFVFTFRDLQSAQPIPRHTWKGVIDLDEQKKDAYYFYQSVWSDEPMVHIEQNSWTPRTVWPVNTKVPVRVFSNCDEVELWLNGVRQHRPADADSRTWTVPLRSGRNTLRAVGSSGTRQCEDTATLEIRFQPPPPTVSLTPSPSQQASELLLTWNRIADVDLWQVHGATAADFVPDTDTLITTTSTESVTVPRISGDYFYRVVPVSATAAGEPSTAVGSGPGAIRWRFATGGWLLSSPAVADLDSDGRLDVIFGSYDDRVYALDHRGRLKWIFDAGAPVLSSPAVAELRTGQGLSIVIASSEALHVLDSSGNLRWTHTGIRQFDRNDRSPALGDVDGDGQLEIAVGSDTGEMLLFEADGQLRWKYSTAGEANRGLSVTTPMIVEDPSEQGSCVLFSADDGVTCLLDAEGQLRWRHDNQLGDTVPGLPPNFNDLTPAAGALIPGGPTRIVVGAGHLKVLDLDGNLVWERTDLKGSPQISRFSTGEKRHIVLAMRRNLFVVDSEGNDVWQYTLDHPRDYFLQPPVCADLNADGIADLIGGTRATRVVAVDGRGRPLWSFQTDDEVSGTAAVVDIDGDGHMEVICGSRDGYLRLLGAGNAPSNPLLSLQYRGGVSRRAEYPD